MEIQQSLSFNNYHIAINVSTVKLVTNGTLIDAILNQSHRLPKPNRRYSRLY